VGTTVRTSAVYKKLRDLLFQRLTQHATLRTLDRSSAGKPAVVGSVRVLSKVWAWASSPMATPWSPFSQCACANSRWLSAR
jgi:hypothetical protein